MFLNFLIFILLFILLFSAFMVIFVKNPIHSILFLILVFFGAAGLLLLIGADFLAMVFLVVYVGAIAVLFLFVVMLLNIKIIEFNTQFIQYIPLSIILLVIILIDINYIYLFTLNSESSLLNEYHLILWSKEFFKLYLINALGEVIYTYFFQYFLLTSVILLVAMIGPIVLTLNKSRFVLRQNIYEQNLQQWKKSINLFK